MRFVRDLRRLFEIKYLPDFSADFVTFWIDYYVENCGIEDLRLLRRIKVAYDPEHVIYKQLIERPVK